MYSFQKKKKEKNLSLSLASSMLLISFPTKNQRVARPGLGLTRVHPKKF
jgi:hypothetical protein